MIPRYQEQKRKHKMRMTQVSVNWLTGWTMMMSPIDAWFFFFYLLHRMGRRAQNWLIQRVMVSMMEKILSRIINLSITSNRFNLLYQWVTFVFAIFWRNKNGNPSRGSRQWRSCTSQSGKGGETQKVFAVYPPVRILCAHQMMFVLTQRANNVPHPHLCQVLFNQTQCPKVLISVKDVRTVSFNKIPCYQTTCQYFYALFCGLNRTTRF